MYVGLPSNDSARSRSRREALAYKELSTSPLAPFLSTFHGIRTLDSADYMELDSAYIGMEGPTATLDIKMGKKTWEDDASPEKVAKEAKKFEEVYASSSAMDGFRVAGMKAGDLVLNAKNLKARCSLKTHEFEAWLLPAFFASFPGFSALPEGLGATPERRESEIDMAAALEVLKELRALRAAAESGFGRLRAASLLFTREMRLGGKCKVRLIDLAHYSPCSERDSNFCDGLKNLELTWEAFCQAD